MKTNSSLIMKLLDGCIEEPLHKGDIILTWEINDDPTLMIERKNSPICLAVGWDSSERNVVFSLN